MVESRFIGDSLRGAYFSPCRTWRYSLWRRWEDCDVGRMCVFCCLNPSTADENEDDPTVRRCIDFSKAWGYSGFVMTNIFAARQTDPLKMKMFSDPIGPENDEALRFFMMNAGKFVLAWGNHGNFMGRSDAVLDMLESAERWAWCLRMTQQNQPWHPLYISGATVLMKFERAPKE